MLSWLPDFKWPRVKNQTALSPPSLRYNDKRSLSEPAGSHARPWKPTALRRRILIPAFLYTIAFIVGLVLLIKQQKTYGAIVSNDGQNGQIIASVVFNYLPIVIAIIYSIYWGWVDLTVKRLEPWFQLSKPEGATASKSLALQYATEFAPFVPIKAIRQGHWTVFASSTIMMLVFWAITPLQGALFVNESILLSRRISLNVSKGLVPLEEQNDALTGNFLVTAFSHLWLGQKLPPFSSESLAVLPFSASQATNDKDMNVTYPTVLYGTNLECWAPAKLSLNTSESDDQTSWPIFDDGKGCVASPIGIQAIGEGENGAFRAHYIGYNGHEGSDQRLSSCPQSAAHRFLALWYRSNLTTVDFRDSSQGCALFCEPTYFKQKVYATVSTTNMSILSYNPFDNAEVLSDVEFNRTLFEYILWNGVTPRASFSEQSRDNRLDIPDATQLDQNLQLEPWGSSKAEPIESMVGFAVGTTKDDPQAYLQPETLSKAFGAAHRLLFSLAIQRVAADSVPVTGIDEGADGTTSLRGSAVVMNVVIASILCAAFSIVALLTIYLIFSSERRTCWMTKDPNSVRKICSAANDPRLYDFASRASTLNFQTKKHATTSNQNFKLHIQQTSPQSTSEGVIMMAEDNRLESSATSHDHKPVPPIPQPLELTFTGASAFILLLLAISISIVVLFILVRVRNGLILPFTSTFSQQILLNYVPIVAATMIEPFWVLLTRHACILQPFFEMTRQPTPSGSSLDLRYASMVPQLVQFRSLVNQHYLIAALGTATFLANLLSIAMSSLFYLNSVKYSTLVHATALKTTQFGGQTVISTVDQYQPFYIVKTAMEMETPLPPWLDNANYYLPVSIAHQDDSTSTYLVNTTGIGANMECTDLSAGEGGSQVNISISRPADEILVNVQVPDDTGELLNCISRESPFGSPNTSGDPSGRKAMEIVGRMTNPANVTDDRKALACQDYMLYAWLRTNIDFGSVAVRTGNSTTSSPPVNASKIEFDSTVIACKSKIQTRPYMLNVTFDGSVLTATSTGSPSDVPKGTNSSKAFFYFTSSFQLNFEPMTQFDMYYHNDTIAADWTNYFIKKLANSDAFLNASEPVPDAKMAIKYVSDIYVQSFAAGLYLKSDFFADVGNSSDVATADNVTKEALEIKTIQKIFMSTPMFYIAISVLLWDIVVAVVFYRRMPKPFLRHSPTSILGILALFNGSHAMQEFTGVPSQDGNLRRHGIYTGPETAGDDRRAAKKRENKTIVTTTEFHRGFVDDKMEGERSYAFGPFIGIDGRARIGIDIFPHATPIFMNHAKRRRPPWR